MQRSRKSWSRAAWSCMTDLMGKAYTCCSLKGVAVSLLLRLIYVLKLTRPSRILYVLVRVLLQPDNSSHAPPAGLGKGALFGGKAAAKIKQRALAHLLATRQIGDLGGKGRPNYVLARHNEPLPLA